MMYQRLPKRVHVSTSALQGEGMPIALEISCDHSTKYNQTDDSLAVVLLDLNHSKQSVMKFNP